MRILLDTGSQRSFVTERVKELLNLNSRDKRVLNITTFGSETRRQQSCYAVKLSICWKDGNSSELHLLTVPFICEPLRVHVPPIQLNAEGLKYLLKLDLADSFDAEEQFQPDIHVLIGSDQYWELTTGENVRGRGGPVALHTHLGWVLSGPATLLTSVSESTNLVTHVLRVDADPSDNMKLDEQLKAFWKLESLGIQDNETSILDSFHETISHCDGRYEVSLPWKESHAPLADNYLPSLKCLRGLLQCLKQHPTTGE